MSGVLKEPSHEVFQRGNRYKITCFIIQGNYILIKFSLCKMDYYNLTTIQKQTRIDNLK